MGSPETDLATALRCADAAAELALSHARAGVSVTSKSDGSPVTEADRAVETLLRSMLAEVDPGAAFIGEEHGVTAPARRTWIIDPIDGTSSFAAGSPHWRVHLALAVDGELTTSVVTAPAIGRQWWAASGAGAFEAAWPGRGVPSRLAVRSTASVSGAVLAGLGEAGRARLPREATIAPPARTGWCEGIVRLLRGEIDGVLADRFRLWDHAPWILLVEEAGGRFTPSSPAGRLAHGGGLYSVPAIHDTLRPLLRRP